MAAEEFAAAVLAIAVVRRGSLLYARLRSLLELLMVAIAGLLVVGALVLAMELDVDRNRKIPAGGIVEQSSARFNHELPATNAALAD